MNEIKLPPEQIAGTLIKNLSNSDCIFIFSTDTVMNSWIEYLITHPELSGTDALPLERFIAWDNFKGKYLRAEESEKNTIPSILKKLFVLDLISKNAEKPKEERFQVIINPDDEYAAGATSFADWICRNLPSLHFWKKRMEENKADYGELDAEDKDYLKLYEEYKNFLDANNLYEPSWVENLDLGDKNTKFLLFYPELLEDYGDFTDIFSKCENITVTTMPEDIPNPKVYLYPDSRSELRQTMLRIIELVNSGKADWSEIALSIPNIDVYRPYIEREFSIYNIPYVIKSGVSLTKNNAGKIFREISDCYTKNFTFDSVRALILDECVPWKKEYDSLRQNLVRVGNEMRCICSPDERDIWFRAFKSKINNLKDKEEINFYEELERFYGKLKHYVNSFFEENMTFEKINFAWQGFKSFFLEDDSQFSTEANNILSRCISELNAVIEIEEKYKDCSLRIDSPFEFFLSEIDSKKYTPQQKEKTGVNIFAYKLSGPAYFKYQFVVDSSQKNLDIPYKRLTFLNATKRAKLRLIEDDKQLRASEVFIKLYARPQAVGESVEPHVTFSFAEETFSGFAIPHSCLTADKNPPLLDASDYILNEKNYILSPSDYSAPEKLTPAQKLQFENWKKTADCTEKQKYKTNSKLKQNIETVLVTKRHKNPEAKENHLKITARGDLENFFPCPRKWLLKSVLKLHDDTLDTNLMQSYDMGNLNHKILELFISEFQEKKLPVYDEATDSFGDFQLELMPYVEKAILSPSAFRDSPLVIKALQDQKEKICRDMTGFIKFLLQPYAKPDENGDIKAIGGIGDCTVKGCELTIHTPSEEFDYYGKIDCLLISPDNDWIIVDYKNTASSIPAKKDITADENGVLRDFQMPLYFKLIGEETRHEISAGYFYAIKDHKATPAVDKYIVKKGEQTSSFEQFQPTMKVLEKYCQEFNQKTNPYASADSDLDFTPYSSNSEDDKSNVIVYEHCIGCSFKGICRTTYTIGGKSIEHK